MNAECPHCRRATISLRRKLYAFDAWPASCPACSGLSFVGASFGHTLLTFIPVCLGTLMLFAWKQHLAVALLGLLLLLLTFGWYMRVAPLSSIAPKAVHFIRWWYMIGWTALGGLVLLAMLTSSKHVP